MKRVLVIGNGGSGKSTLARKLAERLDLPVVHLDHLWWKPGWVQATRRDFDRRLQTVLKDDCWVMDGNYLRTLPLRMDRADTVIFLDLSSVVCMARIVWRALRNVGEQAPGCPQKVDREFLKYVAWDFKQQSKPEILSHQANGKRHLNWLTLRTSNEIEDFLRGLRR